MTTELSLESVLFIRDTVARSEANYSLRKSLYFLCQAWLETEGINHSDRNKISELLKPYLIHYLSRCKAI